MADDHPPNLTSRRLSNNTTIGSTSFNTAREKEMHGEFGATIQKLKMVVDDSDYMSEKEGEHVDWIKKLCRQPHEFYRNLRERIDRNGTDCAMPELEAVVLHLLKSAFDMRESFYTHHRDMLNSPDDIPSGIDWCSTDDSRDCAQQGVRYEAGQLCK